MLSFICERAVATALQRGNALLKYISPNDAGLTGSHQCGYYLPKSAWQMFTVHGPVKGRQDETFVKILWNEELATDSRIIWYGQKTRSEYRLTRFGRGFPYLTADSVGDLLVLIPHDYETFSAYVLDKDEDIDEIQAALGVQVIGTWAIFRNGAPAFESEDQCMETRFRRLVETLDDFPSGAVFSAETCAAMQACLRNFSELNADVVLLQSMEAEYRLFRMAERRICQPDIVRVFKDVDDFLHTASSIMNRRKSRAGRSLENHVELVLKRAHIPHVMRPPIEGAPDVIVPSLDAYRDIAFPEDKLFLIGVKTTCKDRWRQVLNEGRRIKRKHLLTIQQGISTNQLREMTQAGVQLIVPRQLHKDYPKDRPMELLDVEQFLAIVRAQLGALCG